jgi:hypothetical protein
MLYLEDKQDRILCKDGFSSPAAEGSEVCSFN